MNLCSLWYNMSNMFASGYMGKLELIRALPTKEEKAKASRLVLREVLEQIFPEKSTKKKKKYSLLELIDCSPIKNYINDRKDGKNTVMWIVNISLLTLFVFFKEIFRPDVFLIYLYMLLQHKNINKKQVFQRKTEKRVQFPFPHKYIENLSI